MNWMSSCSNGTARRSESRQTANCCTKSLPLLEGIDNLAQTFASKSGRLDGGELTIVAGESTILYLLPEFVSCFATVTRYSHQTVERDRAVTAWPLRPTSPISPWGRWWRAGDLEYKALFSFEQVLIVPLDHPLARRTKVTLGRDHPLRPDPAAATTQPLAHRRSGVRTAWRPYDVVLEAGGWEVIKRYVEQGIGISIVNEICLTGKERLR